MSVVHGDFNGDGYQDLAIGVPGEDVGRVKDAGAVNVIYGSVFGLTNYRNQVLTQQGTGDEVEEGDEFGYALAAGDFNGDGYDDLAVGAPGEDLDGLRDAGSVSIFYGRRGGPIRRGAQILYQGRGGLEDLAEPMDRFGSVLAAGRLNTDRFIDLAVGVPHENLGPINDAGAVQLLFGSTRGLSTATDEIWFQSDMALGDMPERYDQFGAALAIGDFNNDRGDDLAIGIPGESSATLGGIFTAYGTGAVAVSYAIGLGVNPVNSELWRQRLTSGDAESWDFYGSSLAAGDFDGDGGDELVIGVPGEDGKAGAVHVLSSSRRYFRLSVDQTLREGLGAIDGRAQRGDLFGNALATGDLNGDGLDDLVVGVPGQRNRLAFNSGSVHVFYGNASAGLTGASDRVYSQNTTGIPDRSERGDYFGADVTAGDFNGDGRSDLAVAVPGEDIGEWENAGLVHVLYGTSSTSLSTVNDQIWHQQSPGIREVAASNDTFGGPLPYSVIGGSGGGPDLMIPQLNSNPSASKTLFLDFDGHRVGHVGHRRDARAPAFDLDGDYSSYNRIERALMEDIWAHVAEDYAPFDINVTTVAPRNPTRRAVIGGNWDDWFGKIASGVFKRNVSDKIGWVFAEYIAQGKVVGDLAARIGTTASHEIGHSFGLHHKNDYDAMGRRIRKYSSGTSEWTPIMGNNLSEDRTVWTRPEVGIGPDLVVKGSNDYGRLSRRIGLRADDHGDTVATATTVDFATEMVLTGIIGTRSDGDYFRFFVPGSGTLTMDLRVADVGPNLDGWLIFGESARGTILASDMPDDTLNASITRTVAAGDYYLRVGPQHSEGSMGQYSVYVRWTIPVQPIDVVSQTTATTDLSGRHVEPPPPLSPPDLPDSPDLPTQLPYPMPLDAGQPLVCPYPMPLEPARVTAQNHDACFDSLTDWLVESLDLGESLSKLIIV